MYFRGVGWLKNWICLLYCACHTRCIVTHPLERPTPAIAFETAAKPTCLVLLWQTATSIAPATKNDNWTSKSILTSKSASRHSSVQFLISHLIRWLRTRRFSAPTMPQTIGKHNMFSIFLRFRALWSSFFWVFLFSDFFSSAFFSSLPLPTSAASSVHVVGSLTSKLPSNI